MILRFLKEILVEKRNGRAKAVALSINFVIEAYNTILSVYLYVNFF